MNVRRAIRCAISREERLERQVGVEGAWRPVRDWQAGWLTRNLSPADSLLDVGCGPLRGGIPVIEYLDAHKYTGIDLRPRAIRDARREVRRHRLTAKHPRLVVSSTFGAELPGPIDAAWVFQVAYHLTDDLAEALFAQLGRLVGREAWMNVNTNLPELTWQDFPFVQRPVEFYQSLGERHGLHVKSLGLLGDLDYPRELPGDSNTMLWITRE